MKPTQPTRVSQAKPLQVRRTDDLLRGRVSIPGATYFVTLCTSDRVPGLIEPSVAHALVELWRGLHRDKTIEFLCGTVMPDHLHILFTLGSSLDLSQVVSRVKSLGLKALETKNLSWQRNFYDHRLRKKTNFEQFELYTYLNPYRKRLISADKTWPYWTINSNYTPRFVEQLDTNKTPPLAWLSETDTLEELIEADLST